MPYKAASRDTHKILWTKCTLASHFIQELVLGRLGDAWRHKQKQSVIIA